MAITGKIRLIPGSSRVLGAAYIKAAVAGDYWYEVVDGRSLLGSEFPLASDQTKFVRSAPASYPFDPGSPSLDATSIAAIGGPPVNGSPPSISGTPQVGQLLTRINGVWAGNGISFAHQWYVAGVAINGATGQTYTPVSADVGKSVTVRTVASNYAGSASATSAATAAVFSGGMTTPATSPGGGQNNTADHSDSNNAYLLALMAA